MVELKKDYKIGKRRFGKINWIGSFTLYKKETLRFLIVFGQTVLGPVVTAFLFLLVISLAIGPNKGLVLGVPFIELTNWNHKKLYALKGEVISKGIQSITGMHMPVFEKCRFQDGAANQRVFGDEPAQYRKAFHATFDC